MGESEPEDTAGASSSYQRVGLQLQAARLAADLDLNDIATRTRVPIRQLEAIERSDYSQLPSMTYAIGFARSYARAVGADERAIAADLRAELGRHPIGEVEPVPYEPVDPARLPSRLLAWTVAILGVLMVGGYMIWRNIALSAPVDVPAAAAPAVTRTATSAAPSANAPSAASGPVVLTATAPVWLRIYDKSDKVLLEKVLQTGETYTVPATADTPMVRTGRADTIKVTVAGREVAPLGPAETTVRDVGISAAALAARAAVAPAASNAAQSSATQGGAGSAAHARPLLR